MQVGVREHGELGEHSGHLQVHIVGLWDREESERKLHRESAAGSMCRTALNESHKLTQSEAFNDSSLNTAAKKCISLKNLHIPHPT